MRRSSVSRPARAFRALALAAALTAGAAPARAQGVSFGPAVVVVDRDRVMRDAAAAEALNALEVEARLALREELDAIKAELQAREAELVELRGALPREDFDERVRAFDQRVRAARRAAQDEAAALQARFETARAALAAALGPVLEDVMRERGALVTLDADTVLRAAPGLDATEDAIAGLDAAVPAEAAAALLDVPAGER